MFVPPENADAPSFLPDGDTVAYARGDVVWLSDLEGREKREAGVIGFSPKLSPDGSSWVVARNTVGRRDGVSSEVRIIRPGVEGWVVVSGGLDFAAGPEWSPDGRTIAMSCAREYEPRHGSIPIAVAIDSRSDESIGICTANPNGTNVVKIIEEGANPTWSPDGQWIAYESVGELYVARADGSEAHPITNCACHPSQPDWGP
jgi:Tol biopolymer transport system component